MSAEGFKFFPFYERLVVRFAPRLAGKLFVSGLLGFAFFAVHFLSIGSEIFEDWSWFRGVLITTAMLCLYYATHTVREILAEMEMRSGADGDREYIAQLKHTLSDRNFVKAGLFFGALNCAFGYSFGLPYSELSALITIVGGYFLAGFVCGMAAWGICGVSVFISTFARTSKPSIDFSSPDSCGGTSFLGEALIIFASVTLIVGVMISVYILNTDWSRGDSDWWVVFLKWFWIAFPYVMSLVALMAPAAPINKALKEYKMEEEAVFKSRLAEIRRRLEDDQLGSDVRQDLRDDYQFQKGIRADLHKMRTWPFGLGENLKYVSVLGANLYVSANNASVWIEENVGNFGA